MQRRIFLKQSLILSAAACLDWQSVTAKSKETVLSILHTNDTHSRLDPFPKDGREFSGQGGMANRVAAIKKLKEQCPNLLLLDAGDVFQGTPYFNFFNGEPEILAMNEAGYAASTLGNHDFDIGIAGFAKAYEKADFAFLSANYDFKQTALNGRIKPYKIFKSGGLKVGVFGLGINPDGLISTKNYAGLKYIPAISMAKEMVQELKNQKVDLVICLSHLGYKYDDATKESDLRLAKEVSGIDLIIGGHTHTFLQSATQIQNPEGHATLVNQVGWAGLRLGRIDFTFSNGIKQGSQAFASQIIGENRV